MKTYLKNEEKKPRIFYTDNVVADQPGLERWIPSMKETVQHTNEELGVNSGLPAYTLPDDVSIIYMQSAVQINTMASRLIDCLHADIISGRIILIYVVGFDCEWTTKYINKASFRQKISLIQITFKKSVYLSHLGNTHQMPGQLKLLIEDINVIKVGRCVKQDLQKLEADYHVDKTSYHPKAFLDLGSRYMEMGHTDSLKQWSLQKLCDDVLGKYLLAKPSSVRCGDWQATVLDADERKYAAIDAYVALDFSKN
ncbi:ribonuclease H-like domain-containing protein [Parasitella parasitica]|nr:ribonuclease H-like domain-containing protein [Parasitella parasitica]